MNAYNPYIMQAQGLDQQGLAPVFQNIAQQQAAHNAALAEQNQQVAQAGQTPQGGGMNPMAMAAALRGKQPEGAPSAWDNTKAWINSKFGRDPLQPDVGQAAQTAQQYYGNTYNQNAGWSS
jgi:rubrerythrin